LHWNAISDSCFGTEDQYGLATFRNALGAYALSYELVLPHCNTQTLSEDVQTERVAADGLWRRPHERSEPKTNATCFNIKLYSGHLEVHWVRMRCCRTWLKHTAYTIMSKHSGGMSRMNTRPSLLWKAEDSISINPMSKNPISKNLRFLNLRFLNPVLPTFEKNHNST